MSVRRHLSAAVRVGCLVAVAVGAGLVVTAGLSYLTLAALAEDLQ